MAGTGGDVVTGVGADVEADVRETVAGAMEDAQESVRGAEEVVAFFAARMLLTALSGMRACPRMGYCPWRLSSQHVAFKSSLVRGQTDPSEQLLSCRDSTTSPKHV